MLPSQTSQDKYFSNLELTDFVGKFSLLFSLLPIFLCVDNFQLYISRKNSDYNDYIFNQIYAYYFQ